MPMFMVERAAPGLAPESLAEARRCLREAVRRVSIGDVRVRYVRCTFIPDQQRCLDLFEAASADVVRRVNDIAQVPFRWIGQVAEEAEPGMSVGPPI